MKDVSAAETPAPGASGSGQVDSDTSTVGGGSGGDSDADEAGNLQGFVSYDDVEEPASDVTDSGEETQYDDDVSEQQEAAAALRARLSGKTTKRRRSRSTSSRSASPGCARARKVAKTSAARRVGGGSSPRPGCLPRPLFRHPGASGRDLRLSLHLVVFPPLLPSPLPPSALFGFLVLALALLLSLRVLVPPLVRRPRRGRRSVSCLRGPRRT